MNIAERRISPVAEDSKSGASDLQHIVLSFDDNSLVQQLFGQYDEHLAIIEQQLGVEATARGNVVEIKGAEEAAERAKIALEFLYRRLTEGQHVEPGDVDGAVRMTSDQSQLSLPTMEKKARMALAQIATRKENGYRENQNSGCLHSRL